MYRIETERGDIFDVNMMIAMEATVRGSATENELVFAFNEAVASFEILNSKVVIDENGDAFYDKTALPQNSIRFKDIELCELIREQERIRFRIEDGEFLRCFVSRANSETMKMVFLMHHLGGDGKSLMYFIEAFLKYLNGEKREYQRIVLLDKNTLPQAAKLPLWAKWLVKSYNKKWQKERRVFDFHDMSEAYEKFWENHSTVVRNEVTEGEKLREKLRGRIYILYNCRDDTR